MSQVLEKAERIFVSLWRAHYRIPRYGYLFALALSVAALVLDLDSKLPAQLRSEGEPLVLLVVVLSLVGLGRWAVESRRQPALVVARFSSALPEQSRLVQERIMALLNERLTEAFPYRLVPIEQVVGLHQAALASRIRRRLRALMLCYGHLEQAGTQPGSPGKRP